MSAGDLFRLDGQIAVVIGGAGGLGAAMARGLADAGAAVAVADLAGDRSKTVVDAITGAGGRARAFDVDVSSRDGIERLIAAVEDTLGPIDALVNSAGITRRHPALAFPESDWQRILDVNLSGVFYACQAAGRRMVERRRGRIVNIASIAGEIGLPGTIAYCAAKGGVVMLTRALAVNLIHAEPGYEARVMRRVPMGRMGQPDELIGTVVYLASDASAMVTGHVLAVDGGVLAS